MMMSINNPSPVDDPGLMAAYEQEALQRYDPEIVKASWKRWRGYSEDEKAKIMAEGNQVYGDIVKVIEKGADSEAVQACIARWHTHMQFFWSPSDAQLVSIAEGYVLDDRFKATFDKFHPDLAAFIGEAVRVYVNRRSASTRERAK